MSFIIAVHVKEGIVLAGDSRTTYTQTAKSGDVTTIKIGTHTTDTTNKVFLCQIILALLLVETHLLMEFQLQDILNHS